MLPFYRAPYLINGAIVPVPTTGTFTVPVCTTIERYEKITNALWYYGAEVGDGNFDHLVDWLDALSRIQEGCVDFAETCRSFVPSSERVSWFPENPYEPLPDVPDGYPAHPFTVVNGDNIADWLISWGLGYQQGDVFVDISKLPVFTGWEEILENYANMPSFEIGGLSGAGRIKAHLLSIPFGGRILVVVDGVVDLLNLQAVELDRDVTFPPESIVELTIETVITGEGEHTVRYVWYPTVGAELPPVAFGGGVRSFELCGFGVTDGDGDMCCDETNEKIGVTNELLERILKMIDGGFKIVPLTDGIPPDEASTGCAPFGYDLDPDDEGDAVAKRVAALCYVTHYYVLNVMYRAAIESMLPLDTLAGLFPPIVNGGLPSLNLINPVWGTAWNLSTFLVALGLGGLDALVCEMVEGLSSKINTRKNFALSIAPPTEDMEVGDYVLRELLYLTNQSLAAWKIFNDALIKAMDIDLSEFECPCAPPPTACVDVWDVVNPNSVVFPNVTIEAVEGVPYLYHITNPTTDTTGFGVYGASFAVAGNCCFDIAAPPDGYVMQDQAQHKVWDCSLTEGSLEVGGGVPVSCVTRFDWDRGTGGAIDTYLIIKPHEGEPCT